MAGLLDIPGGYWGDTTTKDPTTGLTQADRRDPLWAGLIQGGMGLLAAGQDLRPEQRATLMAQAGQTYGGIPAAMMAQKTAGAQQVLQQQQVKAGQSKLDAQARFSAMAKTPEFQAAIARLEPEERMLLQGFVDAGDMNNAQQMLASAARTRQAQAETARKEAREDTRAAAAEAKEAAGPMKGTGERNQLYNWLMTKPPDSQEYKIAYEYFNQDQTVQTPAGTQTIPKMNLEDRPKPTWRGTAPPPAVPPVPAPPAGQTATDPNTGITVETSADGKTVTETDPKTGVQTIREEGKTPRKVTPKGPDQAEVQKFHTAEREGKAIIEGLENFRKISRDASPQDRLKSVLGFSTALNTAYGISTMLAKGEALFNLGVLNGPDLDVIRRILPDPSTFKGSMSDAEQAIDQVIQIITSRLATSEKQIYPRGRPGAAPAAAPAAAVPTQAEIAAEMERRRRAKEGGQ